MPLTTNFLNHKYRFGSEISRSSKMMNIDSNTKIEVIEIIELFRGRLSNQWLDEYRIDAESGEWVVALENLCTQIEEFGILPSAAEYERICKLGRSMNIDEKRWNFLTPEKNKT